jgi:integrase
MAVGKITISSIAKLSGWLCDTHVTGFCARRQTNGVFYYVRYRHNGTQVVRSIGRHGPLTPDTARAKALQLLGTVAGGSDPFAQALSGEGFPAAIERYLERKKASLKPSSFAEAGRYLRGHAAPLHSLRLSQIDRRKIAALLGEIETSCGPVSRNRLRSALSGFFSWCIQEGLIDVNPATGTGKADEGGSRERVLTQEELRKLWRSLGDDAFSNVVRLLLLLGQRRNEIGKLAWSEIDVGRKVIVLPKERAKNGRQHELPLSTQALAIIAGIPRRNTTEFLFAKRGFTNWDGAKQELDKRLGIAPWRLHDLRRSCATYMGELGVLPHVVEQALNHVTGHKAGVAGTYNRSKMSDAVREGLQRWADWLELIANGQA